MRKKVFPLAFVLALLVVAAVPTFAAANPGAPTFGEAIYADGVAWGTKGTTLLPAPNEHNMQSFDGLYHFTNSTFGGDQLAVAEAGPGNPAYNGGRWIPYDVTWAMSATQVLVTSYDQLMALEVAGDVTIDQSGQANQCPLLPVKDS